MFSNKIVKSLEKSSWIRAMFEEGARLAKEYGAENVYDYSIGNPYLEPPKEVMEALRKYTSDEVKGVHRYMSNAGYVDVREKLAAKISEESGINISPENIIMTVGAAGALNVTLKALLNEEEEVILFSPYFVEYGTYIDNVGGKAVVIPTEKETFEPDLKILEEAINKNTKAIIINSPNNPTGVIYKEDKLKAMEEVLKRKEKELGIKIYVISDEPYSKIVYDGVKIPAVLGIFENAIVVNSYSKSLGLAGERIGYIGVSSKIEDGEILVSALAYCNRTLGFVNAPGLFQKVIGDSLDAAIDVNEYKIRRDYLYENLTRLGFEIVKPEGAFYLFPKALIEDDVAFVRAAQKYNILLVPGSGFGCPGYFRMSYCVTMEMIEKSIPAFEKLVAEFK
ncbi:pyridoxal phosphate-dependent aminotransferase [Clostridium grantii]|uniref:Aminotransferase n=1 Tax=Clostridium grantii DSM 8605 TaxID=1121316 RepID=A0A1M5W529_9CLOT|nr:pyridoxal phosphate-dependent aminotransferase [Clostridium grantii]SHH82551.1 aspartate aminotransferase [Clostridium grantii DSM 8605]